MIRNSLEYNETVKPNEFELKRLRSVLPEYFDKNDNFMLDRLQETLKSGDVDLAREGYELKFLGKSYAKYLTSVKTETVVVPDIGHNSLPENKNSENLYIVGDNIDALKHLLDSYMGDVKCIYIDPPYNTGSDDFAYNDSFGFTLDHLIQKVGLTEEEAQRVLDLRGKSSHSAWLTFMYPRLKLAKEMLDEDGFIFISIDDNEQMNLKAICDEIFGEQNFMASFVWRTDGNLDNQAIIKNNHEYIHMYAKNISNVRIGGVKDPNLPDDSKLFNSEIRNSVIKNGPKNPVSDITIEPGFPANFDNGVIPAGSNNKYPYYDQDLVVNDGKLVNRVIASTGWANAALLRSFIAGGFAPVFDSKGQETVFELTSTGTVENVKKRRADQQHILTVLMNMGTVETAGNALANMGCPFPYPKPLPLIKYLVSFAPNDALVLDFFSGSATTAHAVMQLNSEDGGARRHISVQLSEKVSPTSKTARAGFDTIDKLGRARISAAAIEIKKQSKRPNDFGYRLYSLQTPAGGVIDSLMSFDPDAGDALLAGDYISKFELNGTPGHATILTTWMLQDGYGLTRSAVQKKLVEYELDICEDTAYIIEPGLSSADVIELVRLIENGELNVARIVVFGYSVTFGVMHELKKNLSVLKSGRSVSVLERL